MLTLPPIKGFKGNYFLHNTFQVLAKITYWPKETPPKKEGQDRKKAEKGLGAEKPHYSRTQDTEQVQTSWKVAPRVKPWETQREETGFLPV